MILSVASVGYRFIILLFFDVLDPGDLWDPDSLAKDAA